MIAFNIQAKPVKTWAECELFIVLIMTVELCYLPLNVKKQEGSQKL